MLFSGICIVCIELCTECWMCVLSTVFIRNVLWSHFCPLAGVLLCEQSHNQEGHSYLHLVNLLLDFAVFVPPCWSCLSLSFTVCYLVGPVCYCLSLSATLLVLSVTAIINTWPPNYSSKKLKMHPDWKLKQPVRTKKLQLCTKLRIQKKLRELALVRLISSGDWDPPGFLFSRRLREDSDIGSLILGNCG